MNEHFDQPISEVGPIFKIGFQAGQEICPAFRISLQPFNAGFVIADVAILMPPKDGFLNMFEIRMKGGEKLVCELTIREGKVVWDLNGLTAGEDYEPSLLPPVKH